jgi:hypothetical protein
MENGRYVVGIIGAKVFEDFCDWETAIRGLQFGQAS